MAKFKFGPLADSTTVTARTADGTGAPNQLTDADTGKFLKLAGDSQYGLCGVGNEIGVLVAANYPAQADGFHLGSVAVDGRVRVTLDGLQATPGTGVIAVGDYVVASTPVAGHRPDRRTQSRQGDRSAYGLGAQMACGVTGRYHRCGPNCLDRARLIDGWVSTRRTTGVIRASSTSTPKATSKRLTCRSPCTGRC